MRAPPPRGALASWSASTSFRGPPTISRRSSRSADLLQISDCGLQFPFPFSSRAKRRAQILQQTFVSDDEQRLRRRLQQVEERAARRPRVDLPAVRQQLHRAAAARRVEETLPELLLQDPEDLVKLMDRESAAPEIGEDQQLEQLDRCVAPLRIAAGGSLVRRNGRRQQTTRVPQ